ncbi:MAG: S-layer homology domain-containing protein [Clostridiales bacterium]
MGNSWTTNSQYSAYEGHGTANWQYNTVSGINLKTAYAALCTGAVSNDRMNVKSTDGTNYTLSNSLAGNRYCFDEQGVQGTAVDPFLAFYKDKGKKEIAPVAGAEKNLFPAQAISSLLNDTNKFPQFLFGQKDISKESTACNWVKYTDKVALGGEDIALTVSQIDAKGNTDNTALSISEIVRQGVYKTDWYYYPKGGSQITHSLKGIPLSKLLAAMNVSPQAGMTIKTIASDGFSSNINFADLNKWFVAYDAQENGNAVVNGTGDKATALRLYGPGQYGNAVLIKQLSKITISANSDSGAEPLPGGPGVPKQAGYSDNSVFYIAVKDAVAANPTKYYYYTLEELKKYEKDVAFHYNDHSVWKTATARGARLSDLLRDLDGVKITSDMGIQYAEQDGYHADQKTPVADSVYKDTVYGLTHIVLKDGTSIPSMNTVISYGLHEEYDKQDANNKNDAPGFFKDADNNTGYLRAYRNTGGANSAVIKTLMGVVVSPNGDLFSGKDGYKLKTTSSKASGLPIKADVKVTGLVPGMDFAVTAPKVVNATLAKDQPAFQKIKAVATEGKDLTTIVEFKYDEDSYFYLQDGNKKNDYVYTDLLGDAKKKTIPNAEDGTVIEKYYGYSCPMYYRYDGVWLKDLVERLEGPGNLDNLNNKAIYLIVKDGNRIAITKEDIVSNKYFIAYDNTQSKTNTNTPEYKRVTKTYNDAKIIIPGEGVVVSQKTHKDPDITPGGKDVGVKIALADGLIITNKSTSGGSTGGNNSGDSANKPVTPAPTTKPIISINNNIIAAGTVDANGLLVINFTAGDLTKYAANNKNYEIKIANQQKIQLALPISSLGKSDLVINTDFGQLTLSQPTLQHLKNQYGDTLNILINFGSFKVAVMSNGQEIAYHNANNPLLISLPYKLTGNQKASAVVAVQKDASNKVIPFSIYKNGNINFASPVTGTYDVIYNQKDFKDMQGHWAANAVSFVSSHELFSGMGNGRFNPNDSMTRGMLVTVLGRLYAEDLGSASASYLDVNKSAWYSQSIAWASKNKIVDGIGNAKFAPNKAVSREELAVIIYNYAKFSGLDTNQTADIKGFADYKKVSPWAEKQLQWAFATGLLKGGANNTLAPQDKATRAEVAAITERFCSLLNSNAKISKTTVDTTANNTSNTADTTKNGQNNSSSGDTVKTEPYTTVPATDNYLTVVNGGVNKYFTEADMKKAGLSTYTYTGRNKKDNNERQFIKGTGLELTDLLTLAGYKNSGKMIVTCADGYTVSYDLPEIINNLVAFTDQTGTASSPVPAMIALESDGFKLMIGQAKDDSAEAKDFNMQKWTKQIVKIEIK